MKLRKQKTELADLLTALIDVHNVKPKKFNKSLSDNDLELQRLKLEKEIKQVNIEIQSRKLEKQLTLLRGGK